MEYVKFGNTGMEVSRLCLGSMDFAVRLDERDAARVVDTALDRGVNFLDTADAYDTGKSEEVLGKILKGKRDRVILTTKFWVNMYDRPNGGGCSRLHIMQAVEDSLRRLQTDYIDLYLLHHPDVNTSAEEVLSTLDVLVKQGKVRYVGACNHYAWQMAHMLGVSALHDWEPLACLQCRYNILDRAIELETLHFAQRFNIALMTYSPLDGGILTGKYVRGEEPPEGTRAARIEYYRKRLTDETFDILDELRQIADKYGIGTNQLAFAWLLSKPYVTTPIMGGSEPEHFDPLYDTLELEIDPADLERIDELSAARCNRPFVNQPCVQGASLAPNRW